MHNAGPVLYIYVKWYVQAIGCFEELKIALFILWRQLRQLCVQGAPYQLVSLSISYFYHLLI